MAGPGTGLKWPNDVMRGGAKLAGILLERLDDGVVLAGIGINIAAVPSGLPYPVTSLAALGCQLEPAEALAAVINAAREEWAGWIQHGFAQVLARWAARGPGVGTELSVRVGDRIITGRFGGLRADGALLLDTAAGRSALVAGDVQPTAANPCAPPPDVAKPFTC